MDAANAIRSTVSELRDARGGLPEDLGARLDDLVRRATELLAELDASDEDGPDEPPPTAPGSGTSPAPR